MKTYIRSGQAYKTKSPTKGDLDMEKLIRDTLAKFGIAANDPCCATFQPGLQPTRYNTNTSKLEYYDGTTWAAVPAIV
jgi:hypothetical protein